LAILWVAPVILGTPEPWGLSAQDAPIRKPKHLLSVSFLVLEPGGDPAGAFETALMEAGYGDPSVWPDGGTTTYPRTPAGSERDGRSFELGYEHAGKLGVILSAGTSDLGRTAGHKASPLGADRNEHVYFEHSLHQLSALLTYRLGPFRAALGPSFVQVITGVRSTPSLVQGKERVSRMGLVIGMALRQPLLWRPLTLRLHTRYRWVGRPEVGPFEFPEGTVPRFGVGFNGWELAGGLGLEVASGAPRRGTFPVPAEPLDSVADAGLRLGVEAARAKSTLLFSMGAFSGGLPVGFWGHCIDQDDCLAFALAGLAVAGVTSLVAATTGLEPPGPLLAEMAGRGRRFEASARSAYRAELRRRRLDAILRAGVTAGVLGVLLAVLATPST
jgi:hypothetical protein